MVNSSTFASPASIPRSVGGPSAHAVVPDENSPGMRILIVSQYYYPERFLINELAEDLAKLGYAVTVLTGMPNYPEGKFYKGYSRPWPRREVINGVEILRVPLVRRGGGSGTRLFVNYLSYAASASAFGPIFLWKRRFDAILVFEISPVTVGIPAIVVKAFGRAPIFFWVQDIWPDTLEAIGAVRSRLALGMIRRLVRFIYRHSDVILVQSRAFIAKVREVLPEAPDIRYFPNPADRQFVPVTPTGDAPERGLLRPGFRIMYAGNMGAAQDLGTVLAAAERLRDNPEIQWILIGAGRMRPWVEEQIRGRKLESRVQLLGPFPPEQMPGFFALADVLLATLRKEAIFSLTIPTKIQAYLACGRPVLVAIDGEAARVVMEAGAGLACPAGDPDKLASAALKLFQSSPAEREAMGAAGRVYFEREFDRQMLLGRLDLWFRERTSD